MADIKNTTTPQGITVSEYAWGWIYTGRDDDLRAAGLLPPGCEPGAPGKRKTSSTYELRGRIVTARKTSARRLEIWVNRTPDDADGMNANGEDVMPIAKADQTSVSKAQAKLDGLPASPDDFRRLISSHYKRVLDQAFGIVFAHAGGYAFPAQVTDHLNGMLVDTLNFLDEAVPIFDAAERWQAVKAIREEFGIPRDTLLESEVLHSNVIRFRPRVPLRGRRKTDAAG